MAGDLNNTLLEGTVKTITMAEGQVDFVLSVSKFVKTDNETVEIISEVPCRAVGRLAESFKKLGDIGQGVRVVGNIQGPLNGSVFVFCEHLEYKFGKKTRK